MRLARRLARQRLAVAGVAATVATIAAAAPVATAAVPQTPPAELVSVANGGIPAGATEVALAGGGRFAAFTSASADVLVGQSSSDTNGTCDVFRRDLVSGTTVLVSRTPAGLTGESCSSKPRISSEGTVVAFATDSPRLIAAAGGTAAPAGSEQVIVADLVAGTLTVASRADGASGALAAGPASGGRADFALSGDGTRVAFISPTALAPGVTPGGDQLWLRDLAAGTTTLVSATNGSSTTPIGETPRTPSVDQYGLRIAFATSGMEVLVRQPGDVTTRVSQTTLGAPIDGASPAISAAGNAVAFTSRALSPLGSVAQVAVHQLSTSTTSLVSHPAGAPGTAANVDAGPPSISGQGRVVAFSSMATNLGAGDPGGKAQVYVADLRRDLLTLASPGAGGGSGNADSSAGGEGSLLAPSLAQDGIGVAYTSTATNLVADDTTAARDAVVRRVRNATAVPAQATREVSTGGLDGRNVGQQRRFGATTVGEGILDLALSGNGRYAAFLAAQDRYAGDPRPAVGGDTVVYVRDRLTGEVESVSRASDSGGRPGALMTDFCAAADALALSDSGRYVTFCSGTGLYRRDRETGTTVQVDVTPAGGDGNGDAVEVGMSSNGRYIAFGSYATNLVPGTVFSGPPKLYLRDMQAGTTERVDLRDGTTDDTGFSSPGIRFAKPSVTDDGRYVSFEFSGPQLVSGTGIDAGYPQAYVRDLQTDRTHLLNRAENGDYGRYGAGATGQTSSAAPQLTPDGAYVVFSSDAGNLVAGKTNTVAGVYRQRLTFGGPGGAIDGPLMLVSVPHAGGGTQLDAASILPSISADGARVAFRSGASNLVSGVLGTLIYARDLPGGTSVVVSRADGASGAVANGPADLRPSLSADGSVALFDSIATNLEGDTGTQRKAFTRTLPPSVGASAPTVTAAPSITPSAPRTGAPATCLVGAWTGSPSFTYEWLLDGAVVVGQTDPTYVPPTSAHLKPLRCRVTATNAAGSADALSAAVTVTQAPPTVTVTGEAIFAQTVTCDPGRWAGDGTLTFAWFVADTSTGGGTAISGATAATLDLEAPHVERWIRCRATITEGGGAVSVEATARYVHPEVTVVRAPEPLTAPREGEAFTCSDTELRVRPSGLGVQHGYFLRVLKPNGEIASDSPKTTTPARHGPLGTGSKGTQLGCIDEGTIGAATSFRADGPLATIGAAAPPTPAPTPPPVPELPRPTASPVVTFATPLERFCRAATYDASLAGLQVSFTWAYRDGAGRDTPVPATELKAGLLGAGQVFTGVTNFGAFSGSQAIGVSCTQVIRNPSSGAERVTRSAVVRPQPTCTRIGKEGGTPGPGGIPVAVYSAWCEEWADSGQDSVVATAPPLPAPPLVVGKQGTATIQLGCGGGIQTTIGCQFTATLYVAQAVGAKKSVAGRAQVGAPVVTTATRRGARLAVVRGTIRKGQRSTTVRLRLKGSTLASLRKGRPVRTILVVRYGRGKAQPVAAPLLSPAPKRSRG